MLEKNRDRNLWRKARALRMAAGCLGDSWQVEELNHNSTGAGKSVNYRGPFSLDLPFTRCKLTSPGLWRVCN
jgi:hypothetical protein